jgi:L-iditol 2-dehydrogenase
VAAAPDVSCGVCPYCKRGWVNLCDNNRILGTHWPGGFAEYVHIPAEVLRNGMIHHVPAGLSLDHAALSEPAASVIVCQEHAGVGLGETVLIMGDGPIGCLHLEVARARGDAKVIMAGVMRLEQARDFGPDFLLDASKDDVPAKVMEATDGLGADIAIIVNPVTASQEPGLESVRKRGTVVLFGGVPKNAPMTSLKPNPIHYKEIRVTGSFSYQAHIHKKALLAIKNRQLHPEKYFTMTLPLERLADGIAAVMDGRAMKVLSKP